MAFFRLGVRCKYADLLSASWYLLVWPKGGGEWCVEEELGTVFWLHGLISWAAGYICMSLERMLTDPVSN